MSLRIGVLAAFAAAQAPATSTTGCLSATLCDSGAVPALSVKLRSVSRVGAPVHILQIGDSHTAGDMITNALRTRLQARYGHGGRGVLAAGRPYQGYLTWGVTAAQSAGWSVNALFGSRHSSAGPALGLSGFTQTARRAGATLGLTTDSAEHNFNKVVVCALTGPGQGAFEVKLSDGSGFLTRLEAPAPGAACQSTEGVGSHSSATITTLDSRPVSITSFATFRSGGVAVSNVGVVGAQLAHFGRASDAVVREEIAAYRPDLIVLAFGTNEGFSTALSAADYEATLRAQVARVRRLAGTNMPIMLLGAPDAASRNAAIGAPCGAGWYTPAFLGEVRSIQRRVARELRLGFWDWERAMGGRCASQRWQAQGLMRGDMVHFTRDGGDRIGAMIFADIDGISVAPPAPRAGAGQQ
jgi:lysophospholipase L1-like esterase